MMPSPRAFAFTRSSSFATQIGDSSRARLVLIGQSTIERSNQRVLQRQDVLGPQSLAGPRSLASLRIPEIKRKPSFDCPLR